MNALDLAASPAASRTFAVLLANKASADAALTKIAKRCARKGIPAFTFVWGKAYTEKATRVFPVGEEPEGAVLKNPPLSPRATEASYIFDEARISLTLENPRPHFAGWTFAATLEHLDGENIVRAVPGVTLPKSYRVRPAACDHCRADRRRKDTYVLIHADGRIVQVGSTCIGDFLGTRNAEQIAFMAECYAAAQGVAEGSEDEGFGGGGSTGEIVLSQFLSYAAWAVRNLGWVSRRVSREKNENAISPEDMIFSTADRILALVSDPKARRTLGYEHSDADDAHALAAETWAETLTDEAVDAETGDYLHNLRAIARSGLVGYRTVGIAASMIIAFERAMGRDRERAARAARPTLNEHIGTIGTRVSFGLPQEVMKRSGLPKKGAPVAIDLEPVTLDFVSGFETEFGYTTILKFRTKAGATVMWFASGADVLARADVGKSFKLVGTIKKHDEYKNTKQTVLSRCTVTEVKGEAT